MRKATSASRTPFKTTASSVYPNIQDFELGKSPQSVFGDLAPPGLGHDDVGHEQVERAVVRIEQPDCLRPVASRQHAITALPQHAFGQDRQRTSSSAESTVWVP